MSCLPSMGHVTSVFASSQTDAGYMRSRRSCGRRRKRVMGVEKEHMNNESRKQEEEYHKDFNK